MTDGMDYSCGKIKSGYAGQRYEVRMDDNGEERVFGWTNRADGEPFVSSVRAHPVWKNPKVVDLKPEISQAEFLRKKIKP